MAKGYPAETLLGGYHPEDAEEAVRMVDAIRATGRSPSDTLVLLAIAIITVFKNCEYGFEISAEEFSRNIGDTVLDGIREDTRRSIAGMRKQ